MGKGGLPGNVNTNTITYDAAISACEEGGTWEKGGLLETLIQTQPHMMLPSAHARERYVGRDVFGSVNTTTITYDAAISACEEGRTWEKGVLGNGNTNTITDDAAISAYEEGRTWEKGGFLGTLIQTQSHMMPPSVHARRAVRGKRGVSWKR